MSTIDWVDFIIIIIEFKHSRREDDPKKEMKRNGVENKVSVIETLRLDDKF